MTTPNTGSNIMIKDVDLFWLKLDKPVSPFGTEQYEMSIQAPLKRMAELSKFGKIKELEGKKISINLKKKAQKRDGTDAAKVRVVDANKQPIDPKIIGNGSKGNIIVYQSDYEIKAPNGKVTKSGTSTMLIAVQVTQLIKYTPKNDNFVDFDVTDDMSEVVEEAESQF